MLITFFTRKSLILKLLHLLLFPPLKIAASTVIVLKSCRIAPLSAKYDSQLDKS